MTIRNRTIVALAVGAAAAVLAFSYRTSSAFHSSDFDQIWIAARALAAGHDPYIAVPASGFPMPLYYPLPAVLVGMPFAALPISLAGPVFVGIGFACLAYGLSAQGMWRVVALASFAAINAAISCQWTPILTSAALLPALAWLAAAKPTTGAIVSGAFFPRRALAINLAIGLALIGISFAFWPSWLGEWRDALRGAHHFVPLVVRPGGALLLLAVLRWKLPEGRLLLLSALIPQTGALYDALPLALIARNRVEAMGYGLLSFATLPFIVPTPPTGDAFVRGVAHNQTVFLCALYLPALAVVLFRRRSDENLARGLTQFSSGRL